jgi:ABC-2 type transport system permease protein
MLAELKYIALFSKNSYSTKKKIYFQMLNHVIFLLFNFFLYKNLYNLKPELAQKMPLSNAIWSMAMYFVIFWLGTRRLSRLFKEDIESGNVEMYLLRPMDYIKQKVLQITGQNVYPFFLAIITSCVLSYILVGLPIVNGSGINFVLQLIGIFIFSQILMYLLYIFCGLTAFWLNDNVPIENLFGKFIMILGGAWVPVAFFPEIIQKIAYYSPFGVSASLSLAMYPDSVSNFTRNIVVIIFWSIIFLCINYFMNKKALKKLSVNG